MTAILSWNIQAGLGADGRVDLVRIARTIRAQVQRLRELHAEIVGKARNPGAVEDDGPRFRMASI